MFVIFFGEIVCFIIFLANIFLIICNGVNDDLLSKALFSESLLLVLTPVSVMYLIDIHKRKKLLNYLKNHSVKAKCRILDFFIIRMRDSGETKIVSNICLKGKC